MKKSYKQLLVILVFSFSFIVSSSKFNTKSTLKNTGFFSHHKFLKIFAFKGMGSFFVADTDSTTSFEGGIIHACNIKTGSPAKIFALTTVLSILNFQIGGGYKPGLLLPVQKRGFLKVNSTIPLFTLMKSSITKIFQPKSYHNNRQVSKTTVIM